MSETTNAGPLDYTDALIKILQEKYDAHPDYFDNRTNGHYFRATPMSHGAIKAYIASHLWNLTMCALDYGLITPVPPYKEATLTPKEFGVLEKALLAPYPTSSAYDESELQVFRAAIEILNKSRKFPLDAS